MNVDTEGTPIDAYRFINENNLSPVGLESDKEMYRVPVHIEKELHTVFVGDNHKRMFDADSLPDFLKHKLAMIIARNERPLTSDDLLSELTLFMTRRGDFEYIGWRASPSYYIVVMTYAELKSLTGN
jgi:hypothetical protein